MPINGTEMDPRREPIAGDEFRCGDVRYRVKLRHAIAVTYARVVGTSTGRLHCVTLAKFRGLVAKSHIVYCGPA